MGVHAKVVNKKKPLRAKGNQVRRKRRQDGKIQKGDQSVVVENIELLSKDQLKKLAKNPKNSIRASGKRKRKMLKRLRHSQKDKAQMEVEVDEAGPSTSKTKTKKTQSKKDNLETDAVMDDVDTVLEDNSDEEMT